MAYEKVGNGYLGKNKYKREDFHPEYKGKLTVELDGKKHECVLAAWRKEKDGEAFLSITVEKQQEEKPVASADAADFF